MRKNIVNKRWCNIVINVFVKVVIVWEKLLLMFGEEYYC